MVLLNVPLEILELIINFCLPRAPSGDVSVFWENGEADMRLVCRLFDEVWSRCLVSNICATSKYLPHDIKEEWPLDSVIWFLRTIVSMHHRKRRRGSSSNRAGLDFIFTAAESAHDFLPELHVAGGEPGNPVDKFIGLACRALVFNHEIANIIRRLELGLWGLSPIRPDRHEEREAETDPSNILPLLVLDQNPELVRVFLSRGKEVDVNKRSELFGSALYNAAAVNDMEMVESLLAHGANVDQTGGRWCTPLQASVAYAGATDAFSTLLKAGADVNLQGGSNNETSLMTASKAHNTEAVTILLSCQGVNVNLLNRSNEPVLHYICRAGDANNLRKLLADHPGVDVKHKSEFGTALHAAMNLPYYGFTDGHDEVVEILLERDLSPNDVACGAETSVVGWAEAIKEEAEDAEVEVPAAVERILRWSDAFRQAVARRRQNIS